MVVTGVDEQGLHHDVSQQLQFTSLDPAIVDVTSDGRVTARGDGRALIRVSWPAADAPAGLPTEQTIDVSVADVQMPRVIDFATEIQPVLARLGCSAGACHGKQNGQNGFKLSLLGFDDDADYAALVHEGRGRRVFFAAPERSLLLRKAIGDLPHGGGIRCHVDDAAYHLLRDWILQGAPRHGSHPASLVRISIEPRELVLLPHAQQRLVVVAEFADGIRRDVTRWSAFSSNDAPIAAIDAAGQVTAGPLAGEVAIMARFLGHITTCRILIPRQPPIPAEYYASLPRYNAIDDHVWKKLERLHLRASSPIDDAKFFRRASVDIIGRLPDPARVTAFLADTRADKRSRAVNELLDHPAYADHWANKWVDLLRPNPYRVGIKAVLNYDQWIRQAFRENWPYDRFVRELLTAQGSTWHNGAVTLYRDRREPDELTTMVSQLFLGTRLECAKCHHHPFEVWSQDDFYSFAAFFSRIHFKGTGLSPPISGGEEIVTAVSQGAVHHPKTGAVLAPRWLGATEPAVLADHDIRRTFAAWLTADDNPYFAPTIANRVWSELLGRGIVEPVDDMRATNPASNAELLAELAHHLQTHRYDLKELIRFITSSYVYQQQSTPNDTNAADHRNYSRFYRQRLRAEVLLDAIDDITGTTSDFEAMPAASRANQVWTHRIPSLFLDTFGRPDANQDPPCERTTDTAVVQSLHLMNAPDLHAKITDPSGRAARWAASDMSASQIVEELYLRAYSRMPQDDERQVAVAWIERDAAHRAEAIQDLLWAVLNSAEFIFKD